jgi:hypothetical protein
MAKVKKNSLFDGLSGKVGGMVFRQMPDGSTVASAKPDFSERVSSPAQKDRQGRFKLGQAFASQAKDWPFYVEYAREHKKRAYNLALSDWLRPPVIHNIARDEERVRVEASDNVQVVKVEVRILDGEGKVLEQGPAAQVEPLSWEYTPGVEGAVEASAWDLAGNVTVGTL